MTKLIHRAGDLFAADEFVIAHGCNARGKMGKGFALEVKNRYPGAWEVYRDKFERVGLEVGEVVPWTGQDRVVLNCVIQERYGKPGPVYVSYEGLRRCMRRIETAAKRHQAEGDGTFYFHKRVAMPRIGANLAGGDWKIIEGIIEEEISSIEVAIYTL